MDTIQILRNRAFLEDLFHLLAGLDTPSSFLIGETPSLNSTVYPLEMFQPFEFLIFKIREFYNIEEFERYIQEYLRRLMSLRNTVNTPEELYISLQDEFELFKDLERVNSVLLNSKFEFPFSTSRSLFNSAIIKRFQEEETARILSSINRWINYADPTNLIEVRTLDEFTSSYWKDQFKIKQVGLSKDQLEGIEESGKIVFMIRKLFNIEIIDDKEISEDKAMSEDKVMNEDRREYNLNNRMSEDRIEYNLNNRMNEDRIEYNLNKRINSIKPTDNLNNENQLLPMFYYNGNITVRRRQLISILSNLTARRILNELKTIENIAFLQSGSFFQDFFSSFEDELFSSEKITEKLNAFYNEKKGGSFLSFRECESSLGEYIIRLLKFQKMPVRNKYLINLQRIGLTFEDSFLSYFIPKKTLVEIEILFRFLFSISSSIYFIQNSKWYGFTRVIFLIFMKIKEKAINITSRFFNEKYILNYEKTGFYEIKKNNLHSDYFNGRNVDEIHNDNIDKSDSHGFYIDSLSNELIMMISSLLNEYYITNSDIFPVWVKLIDLSLEYLQIEYKDCIVESDFNNQLKENVNEMIFKITKNYGENEFTDFLKNIEVERYL